MQVFLIVFLPFSFLHSVARLHTDDNRGATNLKCAKILARRSFRVQRARDLPSEGGGGGGGGARPLLLLAVATLERRRQKAFPPRSASRFFVRVASDKRERARVHPT